MKNLKKDQKAQQMVEFVLLVAISIIALLGFNFVMRARDNAFRSHFEAARSFIGGQY